MKIILHEIELYSREPEASKKFYTELLGLDVNVDNEGLKCYETGWAGLDFNKSIHFPGKMSISFLVEDIDQFVKELRNNGVEVDDPVTSHLGMRAIVLTDPDGTRVEIQTPTDSSPNWLKNMLK